MRFWESVKTQILPACTRKFGLERQAIALAPHGDGALTEQQNQQQADAHAAQPEETDLPVLELHELAESFTPSARRQKGK